MKGSRLLLCAGMLAVGSMSLLGCGGGGSGGGTPVGRSSTLGVYVTDSFRDDFSQVWITLFKIEVSNGANFRTVFEDTAGKSINASSLASVAQLLATVSVPAGAYTQARVTIGDHITLVPKAGGAAINAPVDDKSAGCSAGKCTVTLSAPVEAREDRPTDLVVDFDLPGFELAGGKVRPHVRKGDDTAFHHAEKQAELDGTVSNLSATAFDLVQAGGKTVSILTNDATVIFGSKTGVAVTLQNGQTVEVKGSVDPTTMVVTAVTVKVDDRGAEGDHQQQHDNAGAEGTVASVSAAEKSFKLTVEDTEHLRPAGGAITVQTDTATVFHKRHQDTAAFADIAAGAKVETSGVFDAATQTLSAKRVEIK